MTPLLAFLLGVWVAEHAALGAWLWWRWRQRRPVRAVPATPAFVPLAPTATLDPETERARVRDALAGKPEFRNLSPDAQRAAVDRITALGRQMIGGGK